MGSNVEDLINELNQETENTGEPKITSSEEDHFDEHTEEESDAPKEPVEEPVTRSAAQSSAKFFVNMVSGMMKMIFVPLYKWTLLEPGDIKQMKDLQQKHKNVSPKEVEEIISNDSKLWPVVNRFDNYMDAVKSAPFSEEEKEMIIEPLADCIVHYNWKLSPGWMLGLALCMVMLPRITRMIPTGKSED